MQKNLLATFMALLAWVMPAIGQTSAGDDQEAIRKVIQTAYVEGLQNEGDTLKINQGFHPSFVMFIPGKKGDLISYPLATWKAKVAADRASGKLPRKKEEMISVRFLDVKVTGNAAMAQFEFYVGTKLTFIDYQLLYKYGNDWKIVTKTFYKL
jgi:hypothetical protein